MAVSDVVLRCDGPYHRKHRQASQARKKIAKLSSTMIVLTVSGVAKRYGADPVLAGVSFDVRAGEKVGLVGPNGVGKTTLFNVLAGVDEPDSGEVRFSTGVRVGYLEQHASLEGSQTVWEASREVFRDLLNLANEAELVATQMATAEDSQRTLLEKKFDQLQQELQHRGGYELDHRIERVLDGLGFRKDEFQQPLGQLSGGQKNRLLLAKLLLWEPDLMLLDEPSNHLDMEATQWLEGYLSASSSALIVVSHDRFLLNQVTQRTLELFEGTTDSYKGNFLAYWRQKEERLQSQRRTYERQQDEIARIEDFIRRNHHGQKHAQAEDRRKKLEKIERVDSPREILAPAMVFPAGQRAGDIVIRAAGLTKAYEFPLFEKFDFTIERGQKWGILGPNGCGKTTLLRCITGEVKPDEGEIRLGSNVEIAYFDQLLTPMDSGAELLEAVRPKGKTITEQMRRDLLARFGLTGDIVFQKANSLSGGQRNRACLAFLAAQAANLLILDEPTNHLDLWARDALEACLKGFAGTVLLVSHDRFFLNRVADHLLVVEPGRIRTIEGNYDTYLALARRDPACAAAGSNKRESSVTSRDQDRQLAKRKRRKFPYRKVVDIEAEIMECEARLEELHESLASPELLRDGQRIKATKAEVDQQRSKLTTLYEHWEEAVELN
ncbi:MAG: ABC transporter [Planctomycetaceae bacterium]|nr:ABC transporter [Planctomycetaceae bacterium]